MRTRPSPASPAQSPHFSARRDLDATKKPRHRRLAVKGLAVFATLIVPAGLGLMLAYREGDPGAWAVMVGLPIAAGCAGYGLGTMHSRREQSPDDRHEGPG